MSLGLSLGCSQKQSLELEQSLQLSQSLPLSLASGEIELFSLHRIKNRLPNLDLHPQVRQSLINNLMRENLEYRVQGQHNRYCITPFHLDTACDKVRDYLDESSSVGLAIMEESPLKQKLAGYMHEKVKEQDSKIRNWFAANYDNLLYDTNGNIPWAVVQRLRAELQSWAVGNSSPLHVPMEEIVPQLIKEAGQDPEKYDSLEDMWTYLKSQKGL